MKKRGRILIIIGIGIGIVGIIVISQYTTNQPELAAQSDENSIEQSNEEGVSQVARIIQELDGISPGVIAPNINLESFDNKKISLKDYQGKTLILSVWRSDCPYCQSEAPQLTALYNAMNNNSSIDFLGVSIDENKDDAQSFIDKYKVRYPVLFDPRGASIGRSSALSLRGIPALFIISPSGHIVGKFEGVHEWGTNSSIKKINELVKILDEMS